MKAHLRGFTLLEVLVALAIFAIAAVALLSAQNGQLVTTARLADKRIAHWAALNHLAELQLQRAFPEIGQGQRPVSLAGRDWVITTKVSPTPSRDVRRLDISVAPKAEGFLESQSAVTSLVAFLPRALAENSDAR
ncbi:MAG: type II secretion system minor pseudopilin GspI [Moraxellaceae bacterium]